MAISVVFIPAKAALLPQDLVRCQQFEAKLVKATHPAAYRNQANPSSIDPLNIGATPTLLSVASIQAAIQTFSKSVRA